MPDRENGASSPEPGEPVPFPNPFTASLNGDRACTEEPTPDDTAPDGTTPGAEPLPDEPNYTG